MQGSPYKFLDYYSFGDAGRFFGRDREIRILLADIVTSRLVVLFAKTGTGKTSLINAGVRPRMEERGYATFLVRVREDPAASIRAELAMGEPQPPTLTGTKLADQLAGVARQLKRPIVLFLDQFEEFFVYTWKENPAGAQQFIADVADIVDDKNSRVHVVFSMREEWFVEMDAFRNRLPKIFHNESNLRLRWFDPEQALDAITKPAETAGVFIEDAVAERIVSDLASNNAVEPAQLQIVCDTLWSEVSEGTRRITPEDYDNLGRSAATNIAAELLFQRLQTEFEKLRTEEELGLLADLLPRLRTPWDTKYVRDIEGLTREMHADASALRTLLDKLERSRFLRTSVRDGLQVVELSHDYLVERLDELRIRVQAIVPNRLLRDVVNRLRYGREFASEREFQRISTGVAHLAFNALDADVMLRNALAVSAEPSDRYMWMAIALWEGVPVLDMIHKMIAIESRPEQIQAALQALAMLQVPEASALFRAAIQKPRLAPRAIAQLGANPTNEGLDLLSQAVRSPALMGHAQEALAQVMEHSGERGMRARAQQALMESAETALSADQDAAVKALQVLSGLAVPESVAIIEQAIARGPIRWEMVQALQRLSVSAVEAFAAKAQRALMKALHACLQVPELARDAVLAFAQMHVPEAVDALAGALNINALAIDAQGALLALAGSPLSEIASHAQRILHDYLETYHGTPLAEILMQRLMAVGTRDSVLILQSLLANQQLGPEVREALEQIAASSLPGAIDAQVAISGPKGQAANASRRRGIEPPYSAIWDMLSRGEVTPVLGSGAALAGRSRDQRWDHENPSLLPSPAELASYLAQGVNYPSTDPQERSNLSLVASYYEDMTNRSHLRRLLRQIYRRPAELTPVHRFLATIPSPLVVISTVYDNLLERAFQEAGHPYQLLCPTGKDRPEFYGSLLLWRAEEAQPTYIEPNAFEVDLSKSTLIFKPYGSITPDEAHDSYVITERDYVQLFARASQVFPAFLRHELSRRSILFLDFGLGGWQNRIMLFYLSRDSRRDLNSLPSWAFEFSPSEADIARWRSRDVMVFDIDLVEAMQRLREQR